VAILPLINLKSIMHNMPVGQVNATLTKDFIMRVGVPHSGGKLAFHAFDSDYPVMVSGSAFWDRQRQKFRMPEATDLSECDFALDSSGFTAISNWGRKGKQRGIAGIYPWTIAEWVEFATQAGASWWAQPDLCCEAEIAANPDEVNYRVRATATMLEGVLRTLYAWQEELSRTCNSTVVANMLPPPVPVIQGRTVQDYRLSLELLDAVWSRWQPWLASPVLIGVGSMCRRDLHHPTEGIFAILEGIKDYLPKGARIHVYGVKGPALTQLAKMDFVSGSDSMAWDYTTRVTARNAGVSNTMDRRKAGMSEWMSAALDRITSEAERHNRNLLAA
jgi:hypothetical protein